MDEFRSGGMNAPFEIDMGMEKLEAEFTSKGEDIIEIDVLNLVEKVAGKDRLAEHRQAIGL